MMMVDEELAKRTCGMISASRTLLRLRQIGILWTGRFQFAGAVVLNFQSIDICTLNVNEDFWLVFVHTLVCIEQNCKSNKKAMIISCTS